MVNQISSNFTHVQAPQSEACTISDLKDQNLNDIFSFIAPLPRTSDGSKQLLSMVTVSKQFMRAAESLASIGGISSYDHATTKSRLAPLHTELVAKAKEYNNRSRRIGPIDLGNLTPMVGLPPNLVVAGRLDLSNTTPLVAHAPLPIED